MNLGLNTRRTRASNPLFLLSRELKEEGKDRGRENQGKGRKKPGKRRPTRPKTLLGTPRMCYAGERHLQGHSIPSLPQGSALRSLYPSSMHKHLHGGMPRRLLCPCRYKMPDSYMAAQMLAQRARAHCTTFGPSHEGELACAHPTTQVQSDLNTPKRLSLTDWEQTGLNKSLTLHTRKS